MSNYQATKLNHSLHQPELRHKPTIVIIRYIAICITNIVGLILRKTPFIILWVVLQIIPTESHLLTIRNRKYTNTFF